MVVTSAVLLVVFLHGDSSLLSLHLDLRVCRDFQDQWEHLETKVSLENQEQRVILECQETLDPGEILAKTEMRGHQDYLVPLDLLVKEDLPVPVGPEDSKECPEHLARRASLEKMVRLVCQVSLAFLVSKANKVLVDSLVREEQLEVLVPRG